MAGPSDNVFAGLALQVARAGIEIRGATAIVSGAGAALKSVGTLISGQVTTALQNFVGAAAKASAGLIALGAAAVPGGFKVLGEVMDYLAAVIGSVGVPVFAVLAAGVMTVADVFKNQLMMAAKGLASFLVNNLKPALEGFGEFLDNLSENKVGRDTPWLESTQTAYAVIASKLGEALGLLPQGTAQAVHQEHLGEVARRERRAAGDWGPGGKDAGEDFKKNFVDNFEKVANAIQLQMGKAGQTGFSSITDVFKQIQMQSFVSPIEREKLRRWQENIDLLKDMLKELRKPQPAAVGP